MSKAEPRSGGLGASTRTRGPICNLTAAITSGLLCAFVAGACRGDERAAAQTALAVPGPWMIPSDVVAAGDEQYVDFTGAGPWTGEGGCGGGLLDGTAILRDYLYENFPQAWEIGGYSCRPIVGDPNSMSVHATGRAIDIMIYPVGYPDGSEADNEMGDPIANWLIVNAERIGIQQIIWDRWLWRAEDPAGQKDRAYTGEHPHNDHIHAELSVDAAALGTPFFQSMQGPPELPSCGRLPAEGGVIDDLDRCAENYGPPEFWRAVDGAGEGGSLLWTNLFESSEPSNWARFRLDLAAAGRYRVEFHAVADYAVAPRVRYEVRHAGTSDVLWIEQGGADGWVTIGDFDFDAGGYQYVAMFDNAEEPVADEQHIVFDALRLTPCDDGCEGEVGDGGGDDGDSGDSGDGSGDGEPGPGPDPGGEPGGEVSLGGGGGCSASSASENSRGSMWLLLPLMALAVGLRRRIALQR